MKIITSINKVDHKIREKFKTLKEELNYRGINAEMRVILDSELKNSLHDRWLITESGTYNIPSTDTLRVGQYSEIRKTESEFHFRLVESEFRFNFRLEQNRTKAIRNDYSDVIICDIIRYYGTTIQI